MFICSNCQKEFLKWAGKCDNCQSWNTLIENTVDGSILSKGKSKAHRNAKKEVKALTLENISSTAKAGTEGITTGISEFDNAIGGRLVLGQVILLAGSPGIGKSTLSLQIIEKLSLQNQNVLYICGEESPLQIKERAKRTQLKLSNVFFLAETNVNLLEKYIASNSNKFSVIVVDSIQTLYSENLNGNRGSVSQIAECTNIITSLSKGYNITTFIIGHITKSGDIAGPMILEHMVDTVLLFEGEKRGELRILRVEKNRFGPTDEVGLFKMDSNGLKEVKDSKELFTDSKNESKGSVFCMAVEGNRPILVEVQALCVKSYFTNPRRTSFGYDLNRLFIILAVIEKKLGINTGELDVYVNITGGIKIADPALDLAVLKAIISSIKNTTVDSNAVYFGEVGLGGEIRKIFLEEKRIKEASRTGFTKIVSHKSVKNIKEI